MSKYHIVRFYSVVSGCAIEVSLALSHHWIELQEHFFQVPTVSIENPKHLKRADSVMCVCSTPAITRAIKD